MNSQTMMLAATLAGFATTRVNPKAIPMTFNPLEVALDTIIDHAASLHPTDLHYVIAGAIMQEARKLTRSGELLVTVRFQEIEQFTAETLMLFQDQCKGSVSVLRGQYKTLLGAFRAAREKTFVEVITVDCIDEGFLSGRTLRGASVVQPLKVPVGEGVVGQTVRMVSQPGKGMLEVVRVLDLSA